MKEKIPPLQLCKCLALLLIILGLSACAHFNAHDNDDRYQGGTGDLGLIIERTEGSVLLVNTSQRQVIKRIQGLGDLSHASIVYSRDQRYGYVFGRDGGLSKVDLLRGEVVKRVIQAGNSIGGAISQDGAYVAVSNYDPGGVNIFDSEDLDLVASIPATRVTQERAEKGSKTVGLVDAPNNRFVVSLFDSDEIWILDMADNDPASGLQPKITRFTQIGRQPYDALITPEGRYYLAGLFGDNGMAKLDLWRPQAGVQRIMPAYGPGEQRLPVYKMPHLEGWTQAGRYLFAPGVGHHEVIVIDAYDWRIVRRIPTYSQPVFVMAQPDARRVWVNFAHPDNDRVQVIDVESLQVVNTIEAGKAVLHMAFTPKGDQLWISLRDDNRVDIYDPYSMQRSGSLPATHPSGIFFTDRANRIGL